MVPQMVRAVGLFILLSGFQLRALDREKSVGQLIHTSWTAAQGAPDDIHAIAQTSDGFLWLAGSSGLFRFDGVRFEPFRPANGDDFALKRIPELVATTDGSLWIRAQSGSVGRLLSGRLTWFSDRDGLAPTLGLTACNDGSPIAATARGLVRFTGQAWRDFGKPWDYSNQPVQQVYCDHEGALWARLERGPLLVLPRGSDRFIETGENTRELLGFAEAVDGTMWAAEQNHYAHTIRRIGDRSPETEVGVGPSAVLCDRDGALWIGSSGDGLRRVTHPERIKGRRIARFGPEAEAYTQKEGLSANYTWCLFEDRDGNIWVGTVNGMDRFRDAIFTQVPIPNPDARRGISAISDGSLVMYATTPIGVLRINADGTQGYLPTTEFFSLCEDEEGSLYGVNPTVSSVLWWRGGRFAGIAFPRGPVLDQIRAIACRRPDTLWLFDTEKGFFRFTDDARGMTKIADPFRPPYGQGYLYLDRTGRVWLGEYGHILLYDHGKSTQFTPRDGIPSGPIFTIYEDRLGAIWVGGDGGLSKFENGRFCALNLANRFPAQSFVGMVEDGQGNFWLATDIGVLRISMLELDRAMADAAYRASYETYDVLDGLPGKPRNNFPMPVAARTLNGRIWFAATNGIAFVDPARIPKNRLAPRVSIDSVKLDGKTVEPVVGMAFPHTMQELEISYTAPSLSVPERLRFRYRLDAGAEWYEADNRREAYFNHLKPGRYRFRVQASDNGGAWSATSAQWEFRILPALYQTVWFELLSVTVGGSLVWLLYRFRLGQITTRVKLRYEGRLAERTRISRELHDTLLQNLAGVSLQLDGIAKQAANAPERTIPLITHVREQVDYCFQEASGKVWGLRSSALEGQALADALGDLMERSEAAAGAPCQFVTRGQARVFPPDVEEELFFIAQEAVGNAIRHAEPKHIQVLLVYERRRLTLAISDDGKGFDLGKGSRKSGHWGLKTMQERTAQIRGKWKIATSAGRGTLIEVTVPLRFWKQEKHHEHRTDSNSGG
ncbi:MAG TPA: two-component regulator propeller domain-containing protein [Bryobacteraceae bacterium]|nr:two-component regulator propeller domain-containing protein [Bryobacteraceae bacterium]